MFVDFGCSGCEIEGVLTVNKGWRQFASFTAPVYLIHLTYRHEKEPRELSFTSEDVRDRAYRELVERLQEAM